MMSSRPALVLGAIAALSWPAATEGQQRPEPQVEIVQTLGCVEERSGDPPAWWLTRAVEPTVVRAGVFNENQVEEAKAAGLGSSAFQLIGVADFLDAESLLRFGDRAQFTTPDPWIEIEFPTELTKPVFHDVIDHDRADIDGSYLSNIVI